MSFIKEAILLQNVTSNTGLIIHACVSGLLHFISSFLFSLVFVGSLADLPVVFHSLSLIRERRGEGEEENKCG